MAAAAPLALQSILDVFMAYDIGKRRVSWYHDGQTLFVYGKHRHKGEESWLQIGTMGPATGGRWWLWHVNFRRSLKEIDVESVASTLDAQLWTHCLPP